MVGFKFRSPIPPSEEEVEDEEVDEDMEVDLEKVEETIVQHNTIFLCYLGFEI